MWAIGYFVQDMDLVLEEEFLELMVNLFRHLPMGDIWQTDLRHRQQAEYGDQEAEILHDLQVLSSPCLFVDLSNSSLCHILLFARLSRPSAAAQKPHQAGFLKRSL